MPTDDVLYNRGVTDYRQFPSFSGILMFTVLLTRTCHWFLSVLDESNPHRYILFFKIHFKFCHLRHGLPHGLFLLRFATKNLPAFVFSSVCVRSSLLSCFGHLNTNYELLFIQLHFPVTSSLLIPIWAMAPSS